jgi:hypothetical protein
MAERQEWSHQHPILVGMYWAGIMFVPVIVLLSRLGLGQAFALAVLLGGGSGVVFSVGVERHYQSDFYGYRSGRQPGSTD